MENRRIKTFIFIVLVVFLTKSCQAMPMDRAQQRNRTVELQYPINLRWTGVDYCDSDTVPWEIKMTITNDSLSYIHKDYYTVVYRTPIDDNVRLAVSDALSGVKICDSTNMWTYQKKCEITYGDTVLPDSIAKQLIGIVTPMSPFLPEMMHDRTGIFPKLNPTFKLFKAVDWKKLALRQQSR